MLRNTRVRRVEEVLEFTIQPGSRMSRDFVHEPRSRAFSARPLDRLEGDRDRLWISRFAGPAFELSESFVAHSGIPVAKTTASASWTTTRSSRSLLAQSR